MADISSKIDKAIVDGEPKIEHPISGINYRVADDVENRLAIMGYNVHKVKDYMLYISF